MTNNSDQYLKYIFHEDLYLIDEPNTVVEANNAEDIPEEKVVPAPKVVDASADVKVNEPEPVKFLGSNNKRILILVNDSESEFLNENDLGFLMRVIESGLKFQKTDVAIVNCLKFNYQEIFDAIVHDYLLAFGQHPLQLSSAPDKYTPFKNDGKRVLLADALNEISKDVSKKKLLWEALQLMFEIK